MGWCDDPKSKKYNKLIKFPFKFKAEKTLPQRKHLRRNSCPKLQYETYNSE